MSLSMTQILVLKMKHSTSSTNLNSTNTRHTCVSCVEIVLTMDLIVKHGLRLSISRTHVTIKSLVMTNLHIIHRVSQNSSTVVRSVEFTPPQPVSLSELRIREMIAFMIESHKQFDKTQEHIKINQEKFNMEFQNEFNHLQEMMNLRNLNQDPPVDLYDLKGHYSRKGNDEFIKSSVDDLIPIPRESEVNLVCDDLEYSMPIDPPSPRLDVLGDRKVDIDLPFGEHLDTLSTGDTEIDFNPKDLRTNDLILVPWVFDKPLGNSDSMTRSYDVTFSNPLFDFNDDYTFCYDNPLFDVEFEDISSLDPPELTPVIDESSLLVTPLPDSKEISLREVERFDPFFSLT
uniref:NAC domain-containing protein n=1 Tax=Tanacetum cinerariifolium TaxID=118510 RepID=A0A6L2KTU0_TANCI|nr:NAC domain-containing protein [Tanacetum cinerariifolium]